MEIKFEDYTLKSDENQFWIERQRTSGNGKSYAEKVAGYSPTFEQLMQSFCKHKYRGAGVDSVKDALKVLSEAENEALRIIDEYIKEKKHEL